MNTSTPLQSWRCGLLAALLAGLGPAVQASVVAPLDLATAEHLARTARQHCAAFGKDIAVAVVDAGGQTLLQSRAASVGPHNLDAYLLKANT